MDKYTYKLKLLTNLKTHNVFYILLLDKDIIRKSQLIKINKKLDLKQKLDARNNKKYKLFTIARFI